MIDGFGARADLQGLSSRIHPVRVCLVSSDIASLAATFGQRGLLELPPANPSL